MDKIEFLIGRKIVQIGNRASSMRIADLKEQGLTPTQSDTLLYYGAHPNSSISDLKEHLRVSHQAASGIIARLRGRGYLDIASSREDGRAVSVFLTNEGRKVYDTLKANGYAAGKEFLSPLTKEEKEKLLELLNKLADR
ncbi:MAG: MarR family transcriptional regulator [Clostridia bacterium]|nr:MarR family transcriptional regulator [Clostridia bacterium]